MMIKLAETDQRNNAGRSEVKYVIDEQRAAQVRTYIRAYMKPDPHACGTSATYPVHSIYLDSADFAFFRKSVAKDLDRIKLRMRFYDDSEASPVFLEVKRARDGRTIKRRFAADRNAANILFQTGATGSAPQWPDADFSSAVVHYNARPVIHIAYDREAYVAKDGSDTRLTMDRNVRFEAPPDCLSVEMRNPVRIWSGRVILEIKYDLLMPEYLKELVRVLGLEKASASKYVASIHSRMTSTTTSA